MRRRTLGLVISLLTTGLFAWKIADEPVPTGPYVLRYPALFGRVFGSDTITGARIGKALAQRHSA